MSCTLCVLASATNFSAALYLVINDFTFRHGGSSRIHRRNIRSSSIQQKHRHQDKGQADDSARDQYL